MPRRILAAFDLKADRKMRGLSQIKVAEILCTTQASVARWEAQGNMPDVFRKVWKLHWQIEDAKEQMADGMEDLKYVAKETKRTNIRKDEVEDVSEADSKLQRGSYSRVMGRRRSGRRPLTKSALAADLDGAECTSNEDAAA